MYHRPVCQQRTGQVGQTKRTGYVVTAWLWRNGMHVLFTLLLMRLRSCCKSWHFHSQNPIISVENLNCLCHYRWFLYRLYCSLRNRPQNRARGNKIGNSLPPQLEGYYKRGNKNVQLSGDVARFTIHGLTCIATNQVVAGCEKLFQNAESSSPL